MYPDNATFCLSLTYDVEMCTNFPYWDCVWDHRKGDLDEQSLAYLEKLVGIAGEADAPLQWFLLGSSLEDGRLDKFCRRLPEDHAVGNHTYRHVNVHAKSFEQLQVTYRDAPALAEGFESPLDVIRHEIHQTSDLIEAKGRTRPVGFRTPGGFSEGLAAAPAVQDLLLEEGFGYCSGDYRFPIPRDRKPTWDELLEAQRWSIRNLQPYRYPNGLLEIPMMGISDIWAFRVLDLEREDWIRLLEAGVDVARKEGLVFSLLMHPAVLAARDPHAATLERLLAKTREEGGCVVTNDALADMPAWASREPLASGRI